MLGLVIHKASIFSMNVNPSALVNTLYPAKILLPIIDDLSHPIVIMAELSILISFKFTGSKGLTPTMYGDDNIEKGDFSREFAA